MTSVTAPVSAGSVCFPSAESHYERTMPLLASSALHAKDAKVAPKMLNLDGNAYDQLDLNVDTQVAPATCKNIELTSGMGVNGWSVLRMLIPIEDNDMDKYDKDCLRKIADGTNTRIYPHSGIAVVMVQAKNEVGTCQAALRGFLAVHDHFKNRLLIHGARDPYIITRLLISGGQAEKLIVTNTLKTIMMECLCSIEVYLTDIVPILSGNDVILEVRGSPERADRAIKSISFHLKEECLVDQSMISDLEIRMRTSPPNNRTSASGGELEGEIYDKKWPKSQRMSEIVHHTYILPVYAAAIIGQNGKNLECIRQSSPATVLLGPTRVVGGEKIKIEIRGDSVSEIKESEKVMQGFINEVQGPPLFEHVSAGIGARLLSKSWVHQ